MDNEDWSNIPTWDTNGDGQPDFARHLGVTMNCLMTDLSVRRFFPADLDPADSTNLTRFWRP